MAKPAPAKHMVDVRKRLDLPTAKSGTYVDGMVAELLETLKQQRADWS